MEGSLNKVKREIEIFHQYFSMFVGLSSAVLVAEACRDYERGSSQPHTTQQQQKKPVLQKQSSGSGSVRMPPPYQAPPGAYQAPPGAYQGQKVFPGQSGVSPGHAYQQQTVPPCSTSPNTQEVDTFPVNW